jgi:guanylate kinase
MSPKRKELIALAAPSGGGKSTLCGMLLRKYPQLTLSISFTTRAPRGTEKNGVEYHFVSKDQFQDLIRTHQLLEWAEVHGNFYGTSKTFLETQCALGKVVVLDIDVQGVDSLKKAFGDRCLSIFILPPSLAELERRLRARSTEREEKIQQRLANARSEMERAGEFDHQILNDDLDAAFTSLCKIVETGVLGD